MTWNPQMTAAYAKARGCFCIAMAELDYDELFTAVIEYDESFPQPWSRTDIEREITAIAPPDRLSEDSGRFALLSNEGDFYLTGSDGLREKLPGAGVLSPDASGDGAMFGLGLVDGRLWAVGSGAQVYCREGTGHWAKIPVLKAEREGFEKPRFGVVAGLSNDDVYIGGLAAPRSVQPNKEVMDQLRSNDSWADWDEAYEAAKKSSPASGLKTEGRALHWNGKACSMIAVPGAPPPRLSKTSTSMHRVRSGWLARTV